MLKYFTSVAVVANVYLLPHLGGDNCIVAGLLDCFYELCSVAPRCAHHERHPPLDVILRIACDESMAKYLRSGRRSSWKVQKDGLDRVKEIRCTVQSQKHRSRRKYEMICKFSR